MNVVLVLVAAAAVLNQPLENGESAPTRDYFGVSVSGSLTRGAAAFDDSVKPLDQWSRAGGEVSAFVYALPRFAVGFAVGFGLGEYSGTSVTLRRRDTWYRVDFRLVLSARALVQQAIVFGVGLTSTRMGENDRIYEQGYFPQAADLATYPTVSVTYLPSIALAKHLRLAFGVGAGFFLDVIEVFARPSVEVVF